MVWGSDGSGNAGWFSLTQAYFDIRSSYIMAKTADQPNVTTSFADVTECQYTVPENMNLRFRFFVPFTLSGILSGYKFQVVGPTSPTSAVLMQSVNSGASLAVINGGVFLSLTNVLNGALAVAGQHIYVAEGIILNGANPGVLKLQFAENVLSGTVTVNAGATLVIFPQ